MSFQAVVQLLTVQSTFNELTEPSLTEREPYTLASELRMFASQKKRPVSFCGLLFSLMSSNFPPFLQVSVNGFSGADTGDCVRS